MAIMEGQVRRIVGGADTHKDLHVAAVVDDQDRVLGTNSFTTRQGYRQMLAWMRSFGQVQRIGIESTGSYGAGLLRFMQQAKVPVLEVTTPDKQDRRHAREHTTVPGYEEGLALIRHGRYFEAHEELETAWRAAPPEERDFLQGLVHVAVAWYQAERGNRYGCSRQLEKARRRLAPYAPSHRGLDVAALLARLDLVEPDLLEHAVQGDVQPPVPLEEEQ